MTVVEACASEPPWHLEQVLGFCLSPGQAHDAPVGRDLLKALGVDDLQLPLIMDRAYEGNETRMSALHVIMLDGISADAIARHPVHEQHHRSLTARGLHVERLAADVPAISLPSRTSILTGGGGGGGDGRVGRGTLGWALPAWCAGMAAAVLGAASWLFPGALAAWPVAAVVLWGLAFVAVARMQALRSRVR